AHYCDELGKADDLYLKGGEALNQGLVLFDLEWRNIRAGQAYAVARAAEENEAAELCNRFPSSGAYLLHLRQHSRERIEWLKAALIAARQLNRRLDEGAHLGNLGNAHADLGETRRAIELLEQALVIDREIGDRRGEGNALGSLGNAYADLGETRRAIELYEQQLAIT